MSKKQFSVRTACAARLWPLLLLLLLTLPAAVQAQFNYTTNNGTITITGYTGLGGAVVIPATINGLPVTRIGDYAFNYATSLTSVTIPNSVTSIGGHAFYSCMNLTSVMIPNSVTSIGGAAFGNCWSLASVTIPNGITSISEAVFYSCINLTSVTIPKGVISIGTSAFETCTSLTRVYFQGNAPSVDAWVFFNANNATVYYLPGTTGWGTTFAGRPAVLWNPLVQTGGPAFGVGPAGFGFNITGTADIPIVVEACTNLATANWVALQSLNLTNGAFYFSDPNWTNYPARNYRIRSP